MNKQVYQNRPTQVETIHSVGINTTVIRFGVTETEQGFECEEVEYCHKQPLSEADYGPMVTAIIRSRYDANEVEAILNNYLADSENSDHTAEFQQLQGWRAKAKRVARTIIDDAIEQQQQ